MPFPLATILRGGTGKLLLVTGGLLAFSSVGFYFIELRPRGEHLFTGLYWAIVTLTTVGYGDLVPTSVAGRLLGLLVMLSGIGLVSTLTGNISSLMVELREQKRKGLVRVKLSDHILIIGWNSSAHVLVETLKKSGVLMNTNLALVNELPQSRRDELKDLLGMDKYLHFVFGNPTTKSVINRASPDSCRVAYILSQEGLEDKDSDQQSIYAALALRELAPKIPVYAEVIQPQNKEHFLRAGVNETLVRGELASHFMGIMGQNASLWPFLRTLTGMGSETGIGYRILSNDEKQLTWGELLTYLRSDNILPLAVCKESRHLTLQDMLDKDAALDQFILELFSASGRKTELGMRGSQVLVNPPDSQRLESFDGIVYLPPQTSEA